GDEDQLAQVFQNLLDNALKYGRDGTEVQISVSMLARIPEQGLAGVEVAIRDQGDGIPAEHLHRLTERFYRVDKGRSRSMGGTGLGLAIVKHVLNRHRGVLRIQSEEGKGSVFRVYLPAAAPVQPD
ncbi:MAG: ATP-binding protein, partial [Rhodospirillales bacterium]